MSTSTIPIISSRPAHILGSSRMCMAKAIALACFLALTSSEAQAQERIHYSGIQNIPIAPDFDGLYIDLDTGISSTSETAGWDINLFYGGYAIANSATFQPVRQGTSVDSPVLNLAAGTLVGPSGLYASAEAGSEGHIGSGASQFQSGTEGYLGFKFVPTGGSLPYYGWMRVILTVDTEGAYVMDWAYDTTGVAIVAGVAAVPEPAETCVMAVVGLGVFASVWRIRHSRSRTGRSVGS